MTMRTTLALIIVWMFGLFGCSASEPTAGLCVDDDCYQSVVVPPVFTDRDGDGVALEDGDCDDADPDVHPGAPELCDALDNDCNPDTLYEGGEADADLDGALSCADCDDADASSYPGADEQCDAVDHDCDGSDGFVDADADGHAVCEGDCDDANATVYVGAEEVCDDLDNDCNGVLSSQELDDDLDGQSECVGDCDDADPENFDGNAEVCDGADNDCDSNTSYEGGEVDGDSDGALSCEDCDDADASSNPGADELCDALDNDCDGVVPPVELDGGPDRQGPPEAGCGDANAGI